MSAAPTGEPARFRNGTGAGLKNPNFGIRFRFWIEAKRAASQRSDNLQLNRAKTPTGGVLSGAANSAAAMQQRLTKAKQQN
jgi:hypothetical protein